MMVAGENTSSGCRKTYWRSPTVTSCRKTRQSEARWEQRGSRKGRMDYAVKRNNNNNNKVSKFA